MTDNILTVLQARILELSRKHNLSHIGSNLSVLPILLEIQRLKRDTDILILDNAHAHLAHLVLKEYFDSDFFAEEKLVKYGIHCDRLAGCDISGGSLGHGIGIGIGLAVVNKVRDVYVVVSDGSMQEGSNWEALKIKDDLEVSNLKIYTNFNGYTAVRAFGSKQLYTLEKRMLEFCDDIKFRYTDNTERFTGVEGHYIKISE